VGVILFGKFSFSKKSNPTRVRNLNRCKIRTGRQPNLDKSNKYLFLNVFQEGRDFLSVSCFLLIWDSTERFSFEKFQPENFKKRKKKIYSIERRKMNQKIFLNFHGKIGKSKASQSVSKIPDFVDCPSQKVHLKVIYKTSVFLV